jgi:hypothetical protein
MPPFAEEMTRLAAPLATCSTLAHTSYTLRSPLVAALSSHSQYLDLCDGGGYYNPNS